MRKITLLTSVLLTAPFAAGNVSAQCVVTQDCATLGYTETSCENGGIKCPFGNTWACKESSDTGSESPENGRDNPDCTYGAIYYSDGTCVKEFLSEKTAIGIVVYDDNHYHHKWIMSLEDAANVVWSIYDSDESNVTYVTSNTYSDIDMRSCENTEAMLAKNEKYYPAAAAAKNYAPAGAENTKGKWCLPATGIWDRISRYTNQINNGFSRTGSTPLEYPNEYWSSTGFSYDSAWSWEESSGSQSYPKDYEAVVRPVMEIQSLK